MPRIGTPMSSSATRVLLCGCGELGKEVVIELQRLGCEVIGVDRYANAPAMQVAHRSHVIDMLDGAALRAVIEKEQPHYIVPEIEAIATATLVELEADHLRWFGRRRRGTCGVGKLQLRNPSRRRARVRRTARGTLSVVLDTTTRSLLLPLHAALAPDTARQPIPEFDHQHAARAQELRYAR